MGMVWDETLAGRPLGTPQNQLCLPCPSQPLPPRNKIQVRATGPSVQPFLIPAGSWIAYLLLIMQMICIFSRTGPALLVSDPPALCACLIKLI